MFIDILLKLTVCAFIYQFAFAQTTPKCPPCQEGKDGRGDFFRCQQFKIYPNTTEYLHIECTDINQIFDYPVLRVLEECDFKIVEKYVILEKCTFDNTSVIGMVRNFGIFPDDVYLMHFFTEVSLLPLSVKMNNSLNGLSNTYCIQLMDYLSDDNISSLPEEIFFDTKIINKMVSINNTIQEIPRNLFRNLTHLISIDLSFNKLISLPNDVFKYNGDLETIDLRNNNISYLPFDIFENLERLRELFLQENKLKHFHTNFRSLYVNLNISNNEIVWIERNVNEKHRSMTIDFCGNPLSCDCHLKDLTRYSNKLKVIYSHHDHFKPICMQPSHLKDIKYYYLNVSSFTCQFQDECPANCICFKYMSGLVFNCSETSQPTIPRISKFDNVNISLNLDNTLISSFDYLTQPNLYNLRNLSLQRNNLTSFDISLLPRSVISLDLRYNALTTIVREKYNEYNSMKNKHNFKYLENPSSLTMIDLSFNNLNSLPGDAFEDNINLEYIYLRYNNIASLPSIIFKNLHRLKNIFFQRNNLTSFDLSIVPKSVMSLDLRYNTMTNIVREKSREYNLKKNAQNLKYPKNTSSLIMIDLSYNNLRSLPSDLFNENTKLEYIDLKYNNITSLPSNIFKNLHNLRNISLERNSLNTFDMSLLPRNVKFLDLSHNYMTNIKTGGSLQAWINSSLRARLHGNPWRCDCNLFYNIQKFALVSFKIIDEPSVFCTGSNNTLHSFSINSTDTCPIQTQPTGSTLTYIFIVILTLLAIPLIVAVKVLILFTCMDHITIERSRKGVRIQNNKEKHVDVNKPYDIFLCYQHEDEPYVSQKLLPRLEGGDPAYKVCIHFRDWLGGALINEQIIRSVEESHRTIIIFSNNFLKSGWGRQEFKVAYNESLNNDNHRLILIIYGELPDEENLDIDMQQYIKSTTYLRADDPIFWERLHYAMSHRNIIEKEKNWGIINICLITIIITIAASITVIFLMVKGL